MRTPFRSPLVFVPFLLALPLVVNAQPTLFVTGLAGGSGSTVGPDGALYVTEGAAGRIARVDPTTGAVTAFVSGLPPWILGIGGAMDVAFIDGTAYALVTLVGPDVGGGSIVGIYRIDGPDSHTIIADIGAFNIENPPDIEFDYVIPTGVHYAMEVFRGGFLVTDGHLNRVLWVTRDGRISVFKAFGNVVPTGLEVWGNTVYMAEAGPIPHLPEDGRVVAFGPGPGDAIEVASGAPLMVDVKRGRGARLYGLAQGDWDGAFEGSPAVPNTGQLVEISADGSMRVLADGLNIPTSFQLLGNTAYIVSLTGEIWKLEDVSSPPFGRWDPDSRPSDRRGQVSLPFTPPW